MSVESHKSRVLLVQLPHPSYLDSNVPLALGYLKAAAFKFDLIDNFDIELINPIHSNYSGCQRLIDEIISYCPDIVGFSLYLWNSERTLHVIDKLKLHLPHLKVIVGGPEVTKESSYILSNNNIDIYVIGEGEITFLEVLKHIKSKKPKIEDIRGICYRKGNEIIINKPRDRIKDIGIVPSPYLLGFIDPKKYRRITLFTMKGCMLGCTYCSWTTKGQFRVYSIDRLRDELILARDLREKITVYIVDSAFNASPIFSEFCLMAKEVNKDKNLQFDCFLQADLVDEISAKLLTEINCISVEVGLQSSDPKILANINRSMSMDRFLQGVRCLEKEGIPVVVDAILGLPGDSRSTFERTIKFAHDNNLNLRIFNLSLGHGTKLRAQVDKFGIKIQPAPPFYVTETSTFSNHDLMAITDRYKENSADFDKMANLQYPIMVSNPNSWCSINNLQSFKNIDYPINCINLLMEGSSKQSTDKIRFIELICKRVAANLTILFKGTKENLEESVWLLKKLLSSIIDLNPHITLNIYIEPTDNIFPQSFIESINLSIERPKVFLDYRNELFPKNHSMILRKSINIFELIPYDITGEINVDKPNLIRTAKIECNEFTRSNAYKLFQAEGSGCLLELVPGFDFNSMKTVMDLLHEIGASKKNIYFKDWVLQRLWEQNYLETTPDRQYPHYEVAVQEGSTIYYNFLDEDLLLWDAIAKWNLVKSNYMGSNLEDALIGLIDAKYGLKIRKISSLS